MALDFEWIEKQLKNIPEEELKKQFRDFNQKIEEESETCCDEWREQIWK